MIGFVTGFGAEAALLRAVGGRVVMMAGGRPDRALALARELAAAGATGLVSFGIAGGLDPELAPGALVIGDSVWSEAGRLDADPAWAARLAAALPAARIAPIAAAAGEVATLAAKRALHQASGGVAVDLESWGVAQAAAEYGLPWAVLRAVADSARRPLPPAAAGGLDDQGRVRLGAVLLSLAKDPTQLPGLIRVGLDTAAALKTLVKAAAALEEGI